MLNYAQNRKPSIQHSIYFSDIIKELNNMTKEVSLSKFDVIYYEASKVNLSPLNFCRLAHAITIYLNKKDLDIPNNIQDLLKRGVCYHHGTNEIPFNEMKLYAIEVYPQLKDILLLHISFCLHAIYNKDGLLNDIIIN